jgi:hypothetical protein
MGNSQPSYIKNPPVPLYNLESAQQWLDGPGGSDKLHQANDDFFTSYQNFTTGFSKFMNDDNLLTNTHINNASSGVST